LSARLRIGVVGAGLGSAPHFKSLLELADEVDVAWLHVRQPGRLTPAALPPGVQVTGRYEDLLKDPLLQAVLILTPPNTHLDLVQGAARRWRCRWPGPKNWWPCASSTRCCWP
jgi:predicted dehydrogenase